MSLIDKIKNLNRKNKILLGLAVVGFVVLLLLGLFPKRESISKLGSIEIRVTPVRATIHLDQQLHNAKSPTTITGVKPGVHELVVSVNGYYSETLNFDLNPGETKSFDLILEPTQVISTVYVLTNRF
jgi:hypothetical protein